ncbi:MAG: hypothetical protein HPY75_12695 [Actinobacteria bacterium]|nr:hypothetical protein [Actinomycetota bacterium]
MEVRRNEIIPLGYGKYFRSDKIVGLEPIADDRGPTRRTYVYVEGRADPVIASRAEGSILKDLVLSREEVEASVAYDLLDRVLHELERVGPILRRSIREETGLDIDDLVVRIRRVLAREDEEEEYDQGSLFSS